MEGLQALFDLFTRRPRLSSVAAPPVRGGGDEGRPGAVGGGKDENSDLTPDDTSHRASIRRLEMGVPTHGITFHWRSLTALAERWLAHGSEAAWRRRRPPEGSPAAANAPGACTPSRHPAKPPRPARRLAPWRAMAAVMLLALAARSGPPAAIAQTASTDATLSRLVLATGSTGVPLDSAFAAGRDFALQSTGLDCAGMRSNRHRSHSDACQFPARTKSCDRATRRCAPVIADTLPPCLRPATTHSPTAGETQPTHKHRTTDFTGLTATAPAQFTTFVAGTCTRESAEFATHANACADQRRTSAPSRVGFLIWRAAGLLRRLRCGPVRAADAPPATEPLSAAAGRAPGLCPGTTWGLPVSRGSSASSPFRRPRRRHHGHIRLAIGEPRLSRRQIGLVPAQLQESALAASGRHEPADRRILFEMRSK